MKQELYMKLAKYLIISAETLLIANVIIMINVSIKEIVAGNRIGIGLLVPIAIFAIFMWLGWTRPSETGLALVLLGALVIIFFGNVMNDPFAWMMMGSSVLITGSLFLGAGWKSGQIHEKQPPS
jgi:hypothetical protein